MPPKERTKGSKPAKMANDDNGWGYHALIVPPDGALRIYRFPVALDPDVDPDAFQEAMDRAKVDAGMPADADPIDSGWDVSSGPGQPHPKTLARATLVDWSAGVPT